MEMRPDQFKDQRNERMYKLIEGPSS